MGDMYSTPGAVHFHQDLSEAIETVVSDSRLESYIKDAIDEVSTFDDLVEFLHLFTGYNQPFPAGICSLVSLVHLRSDLFRDKTVKPAATQDRSAEIASNLLFAVEDEYGAPDRSIRLTHRSMAQNVLTIAVDLAGWTDLQCIEIEARHQSNIVAMRKGLLSGYRVACQPADSDLFAAIGFHLGSERLADLEFNIVDGLLRDRFPTFVEAAQRPVPGLAAPAYLWIDAHTRVEVDHFAYGLVGAGQAMEWYCGVELDYGARFAAVMRGFSEFVEFQRQMFSWLNKENISP